MKTNTLFKNSGFCQPVGQISVPINLAAFLLINKYPKQTPAQYIEFLVKHYLQNIRSLQDIIEHGLEKYRWYVTEYIFDQINDTESPMHRDSLDKFFITIDGLNLPQKFIDMIENPEDLEGIVNAIIFFYEERKDHFKKPL